MSNQVPQAPDYSQKDCWIHFSDITKGVDTFYILATEYIESSFQEGASDFASLDNPEMREKAPSEYIGHASAFSECTNVFMPYYRQGGLRYCAEVHNKTGSVYAALAGIPYDDISAALDYFFQKVNNGRPFILAGHSQGSAMAMYTLKHYFKEHPEYYQRMVAAYLIGFSVTKEDLEAYPYLKFATGERDTGVIISWNTEGKRSIQEKAHNVVVLPNAISINPLNWKRDETYAPASENLGSLMQNPVTGAIETGDLGADAQVVLERGVVQCNAPFDFDPIPQFLKDIFGPESFHGNDYTFYYNNIKDNAAKRVAAYLAKA